jgi:hypothetical protein
VEHSIAELAYQAEVAEWIVDRGRRDQRSRRWRVWRQAECLGATSSRA